jgi:thiol:disulfide interchange protein DsbD
MRLIIAITLTSLCLLVAAGACAADAEQKLLEPEEAFRFHARLAADDMLEVTYRIAEGYYLYRDRFSFRVERDSVRLGPARFPAGEWHEDEFFGRSEIYRREVVIRIPLEARPGARGFKLIAVSQGCADIGVCYLPTTQQAQLGAPGRASGLPLR